jgi:flagellar hook-associated protein 1 FlgK
MPGSFHGITTAASALRVFQRQMDIVGHNLANVGTAGYSRQTSSLSANQPIGFNQGGLKMLGSGVGLASINRIRDVLLEQSARRTASDLGQDSAKLSGLSELDGVYGEPSDTGISASLGAFFDSWSGLGSNPGDPSYLQKVQTAGQTLADKIRGAYGQMSRLDDKQQIQAGETFNHVNELAKTIADLNGQIRMAKGAGAEPNDLMDQRDLALRELSSYVQVEAHEQQDGSLLVYAANEPIVVGDEAPGLNAIFDVSGGQPVTQAMLDQLGTGALRGQLEAIQETRSQMGQLNQLADNLRSQVNTLHGGGSTGVDFFDASTTGAVSFDLSAPVKASPKNISFGTSGSAGDGGLAHAIAQLREQKFAGLGTETFESFFDKAVNSLASSVHSTQTSAETNELVANQIEAQVQSVSGVNMDEELTEMMKLQRSYQAAAKTLSVMDSITEDLLGIVR